MAHSSTILGLEVAVLIVVVILLGFSLRASLQSRSSRPKTEQKLYQDEDGTATEETQKAYSVRIQNILLIIISVAGFSASFVEAIFGTVQAWSFLTTIWVDFAVWVGLDSSHLYRCDENLLTYFYRYY